MKGLLKMIKSILLMKSSNSSNLAKKTYGEKATDKDVSAHSMLGYRSYGKSNELKRRKRNGFRNNIKKDK